MSLSNSIHINVFFIITYLGCDVVIISFKYYHFISC